MSSLVLGQLVQVPGRVRLGGEDALEPVPIERLEQAVVEDGGAVDHRSQRMLGRELGQ